MLFQKIVSLPSYYFIMKQDRHFVFSVYIILPTVVLLLLLHFLIIPTKKPSKIDDLIFDLSEIDERGYLIALTDHNTFNYYAYRGRVMGFQYDILRLFAAHINVPLRIIVENDFEKSVHHLQSGNCDIIATYITVDKDRKKLFDYTTPVMQTQQVLVQRRPKHRLDTTHVNSVLELAGKTVFVKSKTSYHRRLLNLSDEIGDTIHIVDNSDFSTEMLIRQVAKGRIDYTVADIHVARLNAKYYPNLDVTLPISFEQNIAWAVRKNTPELLHALDTFLDGFIYSRHYNALLHRYFYSYSQVRISRSAYASTRGNRISIYDDYLKKYSERINWDWRLLASLMYQESRFNPYAVSHAGAFGLMQLMPVTAEKYNIDSTSTAEEQIKAGVMYLEWLDQQLKSKVYCDIERKKFIIASYNVGLGHVADAQRLAEKFGRDPQLWFNNVDYYILHKSNPKYLNASVVRHGSIIGRETYRMTRQVWERYLHYLNLYED